MAYFASVSAAVGCAIEIQRELDRRDAGFRVRIGLHAGEPLWEGDEPQGTVVQTARRVVEEAAAGEILVSDVVRTLVAGKEFPFSDRGASNLKGLREPVRLFRLEWRPSAAGS
jgi:class 3 adenylate cyclase